MSSSLKRSWSDRSCQTRIQKCWFPVKVYWDTGRLGMKLVEQDGVIVVRRTQKGTWADEMKLRIGDELVSINGQAVSQMREEDCRETLLWRRPLRLTFARLCRASATPRLRNRTRLDEALSFSQSQLQLQDAPPQLAEVVRSRAESVEVRADEVGEDRAVDAVVTALLHTLEDPEEEQEMPSELKDCVEPAPLHKNKEINEDVQDSPIDPKSELSPSPEQTDVEAVPVEPHESQERQYSDFEEFEEHEENEEPSEYEDTFEIDDEENSPANKEPGLESGGYPGTTPADLSEASHPRHVVFAEEIYSQNLEGATQREAHAQANRPALEKKVSFTDDDAVDASTAKSLRKGTGFVSKEDLPESEDDEEDEIEAPPPPGTGERKVSFSQEAGIDSERAQAMRKGTGFVAVRDLPESEEEEEEEDEARPGSSQRKVSFSQEAGTDSETARAMRKGTGYVPMSQIARLASDEDTETEVDEIRHVSFSPDTATSSSDTKASHRKGTGYVPLSELPDDDEDEEEGADKKVSFADAQDPAGKKNPQNPSGRKGTGFVPAENLPESEDDEEDEIEAPPPPGTGERKVSFSQEAGIDSEQAQAMRKGTGFVPMTDLPDSDEDGEEPEDYDDEVFEEEEV